MSLTLLLTVRADPPGQAPAAARTVVTRVPDTALTRLVTRGGAPAAALLADDRSGSRFTSTGNRIDRSEHFRAGNITKSFIATAVLQLAAEHRLSLSDSVDGQLPGLVRGAGNDGRRITLRTLLHHTSGLYDFTTTTRGRRPRDSSSGPAHRTHLSPRPPAAASPTRTPTTCGSA